MKTIIAGSRGIHDPLFCVNGAVRLSGYQITEVVSGTCWGVDRAGEYFAAMNGIPVRQFPADWETHKKAAGMIRNKAMAAYADALIAIWDGKSRGTANMINEAKRCNLKVYVMMV